MTGRIMPTAPVHWHSGRAVPYHALAAEIIGRAALGHRGQWDTDGELLIRPRTPEETAAVLEILEVHHVRDRDAPGGGPERYRDRHGTTVGARLPVRVSTILGETDPDPAPERIAVPLEIRTEWVSGGEGDGWGWYAVWADGVYVGDWVDGEAIAPDRRRLGRYRTVTGAAAALAVARSCTEVGEAR